MHQGILLTGVSDHIPVIHNNDEFAFNEQDVSILKRSYSSWNKQVFHEDLKITDYDSI